MNKCGQAGFVVDDRFQLPAVSSAKQVRAKQPRREIEIDFSGNVDLLEEHREFLISERRIPKPVVKRKLGVACCACKDDLQSQERRQPKLCCSGMESIRRSLATVERLCFLTELAARSWRRSAASCQSLFGRRKAENAVAPLPHETDRLHP